MDIVRNKNALAEAIRARRAQGKTIGLVPTMGALHAGHISLVEIALKSADIAVASVFVNPTQFAPNEDFSKYPRSEESDLKQLEAAGVEITYLPRVEEMYPQGAVTRVTVPGISAELEGAVRPGHFDGVATIVTKLFLQASPDVAVFGEKDYQQLHVIRQFTRDLDIPVQIIGAPILREKDGLAMSSRNRYLSEQERVVASSLFSVLRQTSSKIAGGASVAVTLSQAKDALLAAGFGLVDYIELCDAATLSPFEKVASPARLLAAARLGTTRLIDNLAVEPS